MLVFGFMLTALSDAAQAQYRPPAVGRGESASQEDDFDRSVDLKRVRKGNPDWDTQELIHSGLTALHRDHLEILKELRELKAEVDRLEKRK